MTDNPNVRADNTCPGCNGTKESGLLLCWPCHHGQKRFNDGRYSAQCESRIAARESWLEQTKDIAMERYRLALALRRTAMGLR